MLIGQYVSLVEKRVLQHVRINIYANDSLCLSSKAAELTTVRNRVVSPRSAPGTKVKYDAVWS